MGKWHVACVLLFLLVGCASFDLDPTEMETHGQVGWVFAVSSNVIAIPADVICLPVTLPWMFLESSRSDEGCDGMFAARYLFLPGDYVEYAFYYAGAGISYPAVYLLKDLPRNIFYALVPSDRLVYRLLANLPDVGPSKYRNLVNASGRKFPPSPGYEIRWDSPPFFGRRIEVDRNVWHEWMAWVEAQCPCGGYDEAFFVLDFWSHDSVSMHDGQAELMAKLLDVSKEDVRKYFETQGGKRGANMWGFWISEHGGIEAALGVPSRNSSASDNEDVAPTRADGEAE